MISKSTLEKAAKQNIISEEQIDPLYQFIRDEKSEAPPDRLDNKEEPLKFIRSFGDVFITLGVALLVIAINLMNLSGYYYLIPAAGFIGLAEWLVRVRRLALPGIAILLSILFFAHKAVTSGLDSTSLLSFGTVSFCSLLFYLRYKMPFSLFPLAAGLVTMAVIQIGVDVLLNPEIFIGFGFIIFVIALWFDAQDTTRESHLSDNAFWLFFLASPLIVHGVMASMLLSDRPAFDFLNKEFLIIIFFAIFFLLALLIDRRAILISTQLYVIYALMKLLQDNLHNTQNLMIYIFIGLGLFVIYFGTYWYKTRHLVFGFMSGSFISRYIPDLSILDQSAKDVKHK